MNKKSVDVIIPTYNGLPWLQEAVESVLNQTHKNLTLYIMDDGSKDSGATGKYIKSLKDKRIVYTYQKNTGQATARNNGIKMSSSEFVAFLDADDFWTHDKLEKQLALMDDEEVGLVYGHHYTCDEDGVILRNLRIWKRGYIADDLAGGNLIAGSASMALVRRSVLERAGLFHEDFVNGEDWDLWLRIALISKVDFVPEILATIRLHSNSTQVNTKRMADGLLHAYEVMIKEIDLTPLQQKRVASYCLFHAADMYLALGNRWKAKKTLFHLFHENTRAFFQAENWKVHISFGLFARVLIGNPVFDFIRRVFRKLYRILKQALRFVWRVIRFVLRRIKRLFT